MLFGKCMYASEARRRNITTRRNSPSSSWYRRPATVSPVSPHHSDHRLLLAFGITIIVVFQPAKFAYNDLDLLSQDLSPASYPFPSDRQRR
jgi:hypothetical protein